MSSYLRGTRLSVLGLGAVLSGSLQFAALAQFQVADAPAGEPGLTSQDGQRIIVNQRSLAVADSQTVLRTWQEVDEFGELVDCYAISKDGGQTWSRNRETSYTLTLRYARFDPLRGVPAVHPALQAGESNHLHLVQFITQPLDEFRQAIADLGGEIRSFAGSHAYVVEMDDEAAEAARGFWKEAREAGHDTTYWQQGERGGWERKA